MGDKHLEAHSRRCALGRRHFTQKRKTPMDSVLHQDPWGNRDTPKGLQPVKGMCWKLYTEKHRQGGMPSTELVAAVRNSYAGLQLPAWHIQRKWDGLSLIHGENKEVDIRKGSEEVLQLKLSLEIGGKKVFNCLCLFFLNYRSAIRNLH